MASQASGSLDMSPQRGLVRRTDVRLRARFPHITTQIFELNRLQHVIAIPKDMLDAASFAKEFNDTIRPVTVRVSITNDLQPSGVEVPAIADDDLATDLEGFHLTQTDLQTCVAGIFPSAPEITGTRNIAPDRFEVSFASSLPDEIAPAVQSFLDFHLRGLTVDIVVKPAAPVSPPNPRVASLTALDFKPIYRRPSVPDFIRDEETWWFANIENVCEGRITPRAFELTQEAGSACYIHGTTFPQIDLRQAILTFDTVFLEPPIVDGSSSAFWSSQQISRDDILQLVKADRVRLMHSQPEERGDLSFLREARSVNPSGVIGRRMSAALMLADIVETAKEYSLAKAEIRPEIREVIHRLADEQGVQVAETARAVLYPEFMRRTAVEALMNQGLMATNSFGQGRVFADAIQRLSGKDVLIEASLFGQFIHTAHILNATYIPHTDAENYVGSWIKPMSLMGDRLNFYRSMNTRIAAAWAANERGKEERRVVLPPVPLVDFDRNAPIADILEFTSSISTRRKGRSLISRLACLPEGERAAELVRLESDLYALGAKRERRNQKISFLDAGATLVDFGTSYGMFPFTAAWSMLSKIMTAARKAPSLGRLIDTIEADITRQSNNDLDFLSKVSRVAKIRAG